MSSVKLLFSGVMLMLLAIFILLAGGDGLALLLGVAAFIVFCFGLLDTGKPPKPSPELPQVKCPHCGREYDFDYAACPYCGTTLKE